MSSGLSERPQVELAERRRLERATAACASGSGLSEQHSSLSERRGGGLCKLYGGGLSETRWRLVRADAAAA